MKLERALELAALIFVLGIGPAAAEGGVPESDEVLVVADARFQRDARGPRNARREPPRKPEVRRGEPARRGKPRGKADDRAKRGPQRDATRKRPMPGKGRPQSKKPQTKKEKVKKTKTIRKNV